MDIVVDPNLRLQPLSEEEKKKAAALFRVWHGVREMVAEAERLGDSELVHFLAVTQLLVEERARTAGTPVAAFEQEGTARPN